MQELASLQSECEKVMKVYCERFAIDATDDWQILKLQEELGELVSAWLKLTGRGRHKIADEAQARSDFEDELADCLGFILLIAGRHQIDLAGRLERKWFARIR